MVRPLPTLGACEIDENSIGRYFPAEIGIFADAKTVAEQLLAMLKSHQAKSEAQKFNIKIAMG
mgnify:CR=1 FL=1